MVERGHEFGTNTGRRRRCGWFDAVLLRQAGEAQLAVRGRDHEARRARRIRRGQGLRRVRSRRQALRVPARTTSPCCTR